MATVVIKAKRTCCKDRPRCKRCPVVCKRLVQAGYGERDHGRTFVFPQPPPKQAVRAARGKRN